MILAFVAAGLVSSAAFMARLLTLGGAVAATVVGAAVVVGGMKWVALLIFFFVTSSALSRWRSVDRDRLTGSMLQKGSQRDATQVLVNGGIFAISAVWSTQADQLTWQAIGIGAIAAAVSDTWSTEIGTVIGGTPRMILTGREVAPGTSGGITIAGSIGALVGAVSTAVVAMLVGWNVPAPAIAAGGIAGSLVDSLVGASLQERLWCPVCHAPTERPIHTCGTTSMHRGGIRGCDNDMVNLMSTLAGAVVTWTLL
jgi:uncharacterized protein (TIGR00297 family)